MARYFASHSIHWCILSYPRLQNIPQNTSQSTLEMNITVLKPVRDTPMSPFR